jgi:zinc transporter 2
MNDFQLQQQLQQQQGQQEPLISPDHFRSHKVNNTKSNDILKRLRNASILCIFFLSVEIVGGILSQSLAVLSDAAHLFADLTSFIIAIIAARLSQLPPNAQNTFGYQRAEALAALFSMSSLFVLSLFLGYEAILRGVLFWREYQNAGSGGQEVVGVGVVEDGGSVSGSVSGINVDGRVMTLTALVGVLVNVALAFVLGVENHVHMPGDDHGHDHSHEHGHAHGHGHGHEDHGEFYCIFVYVHVCVCVLFFVFATVL